MGCTAVGGGVLDPGALLPAPHLDALGVVGDQDDLLQGGNLPVVVELLAPVVLFGLGARDLDHGAREQRGNTALAASIGLGSAAVATMTAAWAVRW